MAATSATAHLTGGLGAKPVVDKSAENAHPAAQIDHGPDKICLLHRQAQRATHGARVVREQVDGT